MSHDKQSDYLMDMFIFEANQLTEQLESILLESEQDNHISSENINEIFRIMHTIKGSAAMMSLNEISNVAHNLEDLFFFIREETPVIDVTAVNDLVFKGLDFVRGQIIDLENGSINEDKSKNSGKLVEVVKNYVSKIKNKHKVPSVEKAEEPPEVGNLKDNLIKKYKATVFFDDYCNMLSARAFMVVNTLIGIFENVTYFPDNLTNDENIIRYITDNGLEVNFSTGLSNDEIKDTIQDITDVKTAVIQVLNSDGDDLVCEKESIEPDLTLECNIENKSKKPAEAPVQKNEENRQTAKQNIISVNINKLDKLINVVGEIVISESMVTKSPDLEGLNLQNFSKAARHLRKLTNELQDLVLSVRMIPIEMSFNKMHRIVRDMSKKLDKEVTLEIIGENTEVDKNVIDNLSDPLMHLIRNSMDHGIESREERIKNNKNPVGKITLEAKNTGGDVIITVSDDGRGLDRQKILDKAKKSGLVTKTDNLSDKEVYGFILLPGFSTKEDVTEFSGRGVGMDVVKSNIDNVKGSIVVDSEPGMGTVTTIKIPLTLAIVDGMMVKVGNNVYIIPTQSIVESFRPAPGSVFSDTNGRDMILIRGNCYPVSKLYNLFNVETEVTDYSDGIIIITEYNDKFVCLFADNLLGEQQVVVKSLPSYLSNFKLKECGVGGCTILGDGSISLILDISEILKSNF